MSNRKTLAAIFVLGLFIASSGFAQTLEENWNDFLHFIKIGRFKLAKDYARSIIDSDPAPVELLALSEANPQGYAILTRVIDSAKTATRAPDADLLELSKVSERILALIEQGRFIRRADPKIIVAEVKRLSSRTARGQLMASRRLQNAGEYAIPYMLDALEDRSRKQEWPNIVHALSRIGRDSIRPLAAALQTENVTVRAEIAKALGNIGYPQALPHLKYIIENDDAAELRKLAQRSISQIDPAASRIPAARLFYKLAENYYGHAQSLAPAADIDFANIWFWDSNARRLIREKVDKKYFHELMSMRACESALRADAAFGQAIGLWIAAYFKAESTNLKMPNYFGPGHADALTYAATAGPEYLHRALARAVKDKDAYVALGVVEALAITAGEKSLLYRFGTAQPLVQALSFDQRPVRYSAAIAIAAAGPKRSFPESILVVRNLAEALGQNTPQGAGNDAAWTEQLANSYAVRAAQVMLKLARTRNPVIDLNAAGDALVSATTDSRTQIQILAGQILAHLGSPDAQRAIATMALSEANSVQVRIAAFDSLALSAKLNANLLDNETIDAVYSLVSSQQTEPRLRDLRSAAASAYGALNLPSRKVKVLILDQARI